jgi:predicted amidophosphoribosyltransferase
MSGSVLVMHLTTRLTAPLADLLLPARCVACSCSGVALCGRCLPVGPALRVRHRGLLVCAAAPYTGPLRTALVAYKERGRHDLAPPLAGLLARAVAGVLADQEVGHRPNVVLVGVPSARAAARGRGGDHVARLGRLAGRSAGLTAVPVLGQVRRVRDSAGLGAAERHTNVAASMAAGVPPRGAAALVVDDIVTSGATLAEAVRALRAAGWPVLGAATVAATQLPGSTRAISHARSTAVPLAPARRAV